MIAEGQDEGFEKEFQQANTRNLAAIHYKPTTIDEKLVPQPQRVNVEPGIGAITQTITQAKTDFMETTNIHEASLGAQGPEQSGKAIMARQRRGDVANFNLTDNLARALRQVGRVLVGMFPIIIDVPRMQRITNPDGSHRMVQLNAQSMDNQGQPQVKNGKPVIYDIRTGKYDVTITTGPSYQSKRQEFVEAVLALVQASPNLMQ